VLIVAGTISAATGGVHGKPTPSPSATVSDSPLPESTETEAPKAEATTSGESGTAPDFTGCDGMTGLDNAICRHEALLKVKPGNPGLTQLGRPLAGEPCGAGRQEGGKGRGPPLEIRVAWPLGIVARADDAAAFQPNRVNRDGSVVRATFGAAGTPRCAAIRA
jgi:hypothetical protein